MNGNARSGAAALLDKAAGDLGTFLGRIGAGTLLRRICGITALIEAVQVFGSSFSDAFASNGTGQNGSPDGRGDSAMKKSNLIALLVCIFAIFGALAAAYFYLARREKELDEYEQMLFRDAEEEKEETGDGEKTGSGEPEPDSAL